MANLAGILVPVVTDYSVKFTGWNAAFWLTAAISAQGIVVDLGFGQPKKLVEEFLEISEQLACGS